MSNSNMVANQRDSTVQEKGFKRKDQRYKQGNGEELEFIELLVAQANKDEMPHILDNERSMIIPCVDPGGGKMDFLQNAYDLEMKRSAKAGKKQKNDLSSLVRGIHTSNSSCMTRIGRMIVAYGNTLGMKAVKSSGKATSFEKTRVGFPKDEVEAAKKWLIKYAANEAVFLVRNERVQLDLTIWMEGEGADEVKTWTTEKEMDQQIVKMKWLVESPEEELRRAKLVRMFNLSLSPEVQPHYVDGLFLVNDLSSRVDAMRAEGKSSMTAEKRADAVLAELDACLMSHKCNDVFVEFGMYFAKVRLVMAKIATLEDKQKLTDEFVWKHVKAEVLAASRISDNRFSQLVHNALQGDKFDKSHKTEVFLRTLYENCREDQVEALKNKIKRDKQLRMATANGVYN